MARRRSLLTQVALLGTLGVLAFPSAGLALRPQYFISLTATGPSPAALTVLAGDGPITFSNADTVTHTVAFANGWCSGDVAAGATLPCGIPPYAGAYAYTVDGTTQATVTVNAEWRGVTLKAKHHGFRLGSKVRLHGSLAIENLSPPSLYGPRMPVVVFARPDSHHPFHRIAVVMSTPLKKPSFAARSVWQLWVRPHAHTAYMVEANSQPGAGQLWENAQSRIFWVQRR